MVAAVGDFIGDVKVLLVGLVLESTGPRQSASCYATRGFGTGCGGVSNIVGLDWTN